MSGGYTWVFASLTFLSSRILPVTTTTFLAARSAHSSPSRDCFSHPVNSALRLPPPSPFAAPNCRSRPKFDRSRLFSLLPNDTRATLAHGRPCPGPNLEVSSPPSRRPTAPSLTGTTHHPPLTTHSLFLPPLPAGGPSFAPRSANISPILSSFRILPVATGVCPLRPLCSALRALCVVLFPSFEPQVCQLFCLQKLAASLSSLCAFFCPRFLCFQSFAASFPKTPGWG